MFRINILLIVWCYANTVHCTPVALQSTLTDDLIQNKGSHMHQNGYSTSYLDLLNGNTFLDPLALNRRKRQDNKEPDASKNQDISVVQDASDVTFLVTKEIETSPVAQSLPEDVSSQNEPSTQIEPSQQNDPPPEKQAPTNNESSPDDENITDVKDPSDDKVSSDGKMDLPDTVSTSDMSETAHTDPMTANPIDFDGDSLITSDITKEPTSVELDTNTPKSELDVPIDTLPVPSIDSEEPAATGEDTVSTTITLASEQDIYPDTELFTPADMDNVKIEQISEQPLQSSLDTVSTPNDVPATGDFDSDTTSSDTSSPPNIPEELTDIQLDSDSTPNVSEVDVLTETVPTTTGNLESLTTLEITESTDTSEPEDSTDITKDISSNIDGDTSITSLGTDTNPKISEEPTITNLDEVRMLNPSELDVTADSIPNISVDDTSKTTTDTTSTPQISDEPSENTSDIVGAQSTSELDDPTDTKPDISPNNQDPQTISKSDIEVVPVAINTVNREDGVSTPEFPPSSTSDQATLEIEDTVGISTPNTESTQDDTDKTDKDESTLESSNTPPEVPVSDTIRSLDQDVKPDEDVKTNEDVKADEDVKSNEDTTMVTKSVDGQESLVYSDKQKSESVPIEHFNRNNGISSTDKRYDYDVDTLDEFMNGFEEMLEESEDSLLTPAEDTIIGELERSMIESMKADPADFLTKYDTFKGNYKLPTKVRSCICSTSNDSDFIDDFQHDGEFIDFLDSNVGRFNNKKYDSIARKFYDDFVDVEHFIAE